MSDTRPFTVEIVATERYVLEVTADDIEQIIFDHGELTPENVRSFAITVFEMPDNAERQGVDYRVAIDHDFDGTVR